ncbi:hypothetical protein RJ639_008668 [Escallonia herrerae]|uniref:Uncharacterized protein n=1 Tax=Escallonia herrerae TaxID=1293975 RepID=A0AA88VSA3_9ASTE|nr:hypothetical protein RJ639_008668 [Escallonia herrerae]
MNIENGTCSGSKYWIWILLVLAVILLLLIMSFLCCLRKRKIRLKGEEKMREQEYILKELISPDSLNNANEIGGHSREGSDLKIFSFISIVAATNDFSDDNRLGEGGFGPVYKVIK